MRHNLGFLSRWHKIYLSERTSSATLETTSLSPSSLSIQISSSKYKKSFQMCTTLLVIFISFSVSLTHAGPVYTRHRRMMREVFSELETETQNSTRLEDKCIVDGVQVQRESVICEKKNGCRAIQKTGYCCPDYQCECERGGKIYENGEKLVDPETPCTVCYCQGGEILCNSVSCYNRDDCIPKYVSGRCCPEYDNCPPLDELTSTSTSKNILNQNKAVPSLGIKIKEITKPEEIRIVDEKPKVIYRTPKPNNQSKAIQVEQLSSTTISTNNLSEFENLSIPELDIKPDLNVESTNADDESNSKNLDTVTQQGEKVVIIDRNGQTKPIIVVGVEGLQRGDIVEETVLTEGQKKGSINKNVQYDKASAGFTDGDVEPEAAGSEINIHLSKEKPIFDKVTTESPLEIASSSTSKEIYETILYTSGPEKYGEKEITKTAFDTIYYKPNEITISNNVSTEAPWSSSVSPDVYHHLHLDDDDAAVIESNPAYPTIPDDDLSIYGREVLTEAENDDYLENNHKSKSTLHTDESKSFSEKFTTEGPNISSFLTSDLSTENSVIIEAYDTVNSSYSQGRAPGEPFLIPEWERNSTELMNHNETENLEEEWRNQAVAVEVDPGSGSGLGQIPDETSSKYPKNIVDFEEVNEASADGTTSINVVLPEDVVEDRAISSIFESNNQLTDMKIHKLFEAFSNLRKNFNLHILNL